MLNRRHLLACAASLAVAPARADDNASPVAHGTLANNKLAQAFETAPAELPDIEVLGPKGTRNLTEFFGRTLLIPVWAEWCAPCLSELQDFAALQRKHGNDKFAIVPILSGSRKRISTEILSRLFADLHADSLEPLIEHNLGDKLVQKMARTKEGHVTIPCNLLVAPDGHVVGREFGLREAAGFDATSKHQMLAQVEAGKVLSEWGEDAGDEFAAAMANGFLG
jgi:thiol-disulfide isomerase/thioredoxin